MFTDFQDGDVVFVAEAIKPMSIGIRLLQGDFDFSHVCQIFGGKIYSTGIGGPILYRFGLADPGQYLKGKDYAVKRYHGLTRNQRIIMWAKADALVGNRYPIEKMLWLAFRGKTTPGVVKKLGIKANPSPKNSFCSGSVALCFRAAGIILNPDSGKLEPDAYSPEAIWDDPELKIIYRS
jgi:hypothetical protein